MPNRGQVIRDKFTGDSFEFVETGESTKGEYVKLKVTLISKGQTVDNHIHLEQDETFEVLSGCLTCFENGQERQVNPGEKVLLVKNMPHNHYNTGDEPAVYYQTIEPAYDIDYFLENLVGMINDGKVKNGKLPFMQAMATLKYLESPSRLADMPRSMQEILKNILGPFARLLGYRALYARYTGVDK